DPCVLGKQAQDGTAEGALPASALPDEADRRPLLDRQVHVRDRVDGAVRGVEGDRKALALQEGGQASTFALKSFFRRRGFRMSFNPSPTNVRAVVRMRMNRPGYNVAHQDASKRCQLRLMSKPQSGMPGGSPRPRNVRPASVRTESAAFTLKM